MRLAHGPLQGSELQGCTLVVSRYAGVAVFHASIMALTFDPCNSLETRGGGRGSKLIIFETNTLLNYCAADTHSDALSGSGWIFLQARTTAKALTIAEQGILPI